MSQDKQTLFDELEADGKAALREIEDGARRLKKYALRQRHKRLVQVAKLNAFSNILFQEFVEEIKQRTGR